MGKATFPEQCSHLASQCWDQAHISPRAQRLAPSPMLLSKTEGPSDMKVIRRYQIDLVEYMSVIKLQ